MGPRVDTGPIHYRDTRELPVEAMLALYRANHWSSAKKPALLHAGLLASHSLITAWDGERLVGLGNTLSDGYLVVYYSHLLVHPAYQRRGIGAELMRRLIARYRGFHQHILVADGGGPEVLSQMRLRTGGQDKVDVDLCRPRPLAAPPGGFPRKHRPACKLELTAGALPGCLSPCPFVSSTNSQA